MKLRILKTMALATCVSFAGLACNGDDATDPTPAPSAADGSPSPQLFPTPNRGWRELAPMPTPRSGVAVAELNSRIYVVGGFEADGSVSNKVEVYDPLLDSWTSVAPLPAPRHHAAVYNLGGLFVAGGYETGFDDPKATIFVYDASLNSWAEVTPLPAPRGALAAAVDFPCAEEDPLLGGCVYAIGGAAADGSNIATVSLNDPSGAWRDVAPLPTPRDNLASAVTLGLIYAIGGRVEGDVARNLNTVERYDPETDAWTPRAPLPTARSGIAAAPYGAYIYVFGGESPDGTLQTVEAYDLVNDSWKALEPMPTARHGLGAAVVGDSIYVIGGGETPGASVSDANEAYTP